MPQLYNIPVSPAECSPFVVMFQLFGETFNLIVSVQNSEMKVVRLLYMQAEIRSPSQPHSTGRKSLRPSRAVGYNHAFLTSLLPSRLCQHFADVRVLSAEISQHALLYVPLTNFVSFSIDILTSIQPHEACIQFIKKTNQCT